MIVNTKITEIIIPANVTTLESGVFVESSITNISFGVTTGWKYRDRSSGNMVDVTEDELQNHENYIGWQSIFGNTELTRSE